MPNKVLFIQTAFLGDLFLSIPLLNKIKKTYPKASVALLCRQGLGDFFLKTNLVSEVIEVNKKKSKSISEAFKKTKAYSADLVISAHQSIRTALWVKRLKVPESVGFESIFTNWAYDKKVKRDLTQHDVIRQISLLGPVDKTEINYSVSIEDNPYYDQFKDAVAVAPGSQWATKKWGVEGFINVIKKIILSGKNVVLVGSQDEQALGKEIYNKIPEVKSEIGKTNIYQLAQLLKKCSLLISNDSGAMHVASVVGTPVVAIFGPTVKEFGYTPWNKHSKIIEVDLPCRPCGAHGHQACPIKTHDCMKKVSVEMVLTAAKELIK